MHKAAVNPVSATPLRSTDLSLPGDTAGQVDTAIFLDTFEARP